MPSAIISVAAYNSIYKDKADFVCDGNNDQVEIQSAINALPSSGGIVNLLDGKFNISMSIKPAKGCELKGQGRNSILYLGDAPNSLLSADADKGQANIRLVDASGFRVDMPIVIVSSKFQTVTKIKSIKGNTLTLNSKLTVAFTVASKTRVWTLFPVIDINGADDVVIKNLAIDGNRSGQVIYNATRSYCKEAGAHYESNVAIYIQGGSRNIAVENCYIANTQSHGILANGGGPNLNFINNRLENIGDKGITTVYVPGPGIISGNYIEGTGKSPYICPSVSVWGWGDCINLHPPSGNGWVITNNILTDALRSGIRMTGVSRSVASNNYISDCSDCGIIATVWDENTIMGNSVFRNGTGITLAFPMKEKKCGATTIMGNIVSGNKRNGIMFCGARFGIIQGNTVSNNGEHGIFVTDKAYDIPETEERWPKKPVRWSSSPDRIIVSNNSVIGNSQSRHKSYNNIFVKNSSNVFVQGNISYKGEQTKKPKYGLHITIGCSRVVVKDNNLDDSGATKDFYNEAADAES